MQGHRLSVAALAAVACALPMAACGGGQQEVAGCDGSPPEDAVEVSFRMVPAPALGAVSGSEAEATRENLCDRAKALGVDDVVVRGEDNQVEVFLAGEDAERAAELIGEPARIGFYDWEANVILDPAVRSPRPTETPFKREYDAVRFAAAQPTDCSEGHCTVPGPTYFLYDLDTKELLDGPSLGAERLLDDRLADGIDPPVEVLAIQEGVILAAVGPESYFALRDRASLTGNDIVHPQAITDPVTGEPAISFGLAEHGQEVFEQLTRRIAVRSAAEAPKKVGPAEAAKISGHLAIVLDGEVVSRPLINFVENPDGIEASQGVTISGDFSRDEAEELAALLEVGPPPVGLAQAG